MRDGSRYAAGIRNAMGLDWNHQAGALYAMQHGRDSLADLYPALYDAEQYAELPAEEKFRIAEGDDFGWPYCYYDPFSLGGSFHKTPLKLPYCRINKVKMSRK